MKSYKIPPPPKKMGVTKTFYSRKYSQSYIEQIVPLLPICSRFYVFWVCKLAFFHHKEKFLFKSYIDMHAEFLTSSKSKKDKILCRRYLFKLNTCTIFAMIVKKRTAASLPPHTGKKILLL